MKASEAEILISDKINPDLVAHFESSLHTNNFEFSMKSYIGAEDDFKGDPEDLRKHHYAKRVKEFKI